MSRESAGMIVHERFMTAERRRRNGNEHARLAGVLFAPPDPSGFPNRRFITVDGRSFQAGGTPAQFNAAGTALTGYNPAASRVRARRFHFRAAATVGVDLTRTDGTAEQPDWRSRFDAHYTVGPFRFGYSMNYLPSVRSTNTSTIETTLYPILDANYRHNISAQYDLTEALTLRAGVENLTDEMPSFPSTQYGDILGRQYYVGVHAKF